MSDKTRSLYKLKYLVSFNKCLFAMIYWQNLDVFMHN